MSSMRKNKKETVSWRDLPKKDQLAVLVMARVIEPLVQTSLFAYMFHQLQSFDPSLPDSTVAWQAGVLQGIFAAGETLTGWVWGQAADAYGRKTALLWGAFGTFISCIGFGFCKSFWPALLFRLLAGLVNGNVPIIRTLVSETIQGKKYQSRAFLLMPMSANVGSIIGPVLGGFLANPVATYPSLFGPGSWLGGVQGVNWMVRWPYLAPNLANAIVVAVSMVGIAWYLEETLESAKGKENIVSRTFNRVTRRMGRRTNRHGRHEQHSPEYDPLIDPEQVMPSLSARGVAEPEELAEVDKLPANKPLKPAKLPFRRIWTPNVLFTLLAHFATSFHLGTFTSLWFIFLSAARYNPATDTSDYHPHGPFVFSGGLGLTSAQVGTAMSILGAIGVVVQVVIYPKAQDTYGVVSLYRAFVYGFPIAYLLAPYLAVVPSSSKPPHPADGPWVWLILFAILIVFVGCRTFVKPATMVLVNNCSPHPSVLGTVHGVAASVASAARAVGPAVAGYLFGIGLNTGVVGLAWWTLAAFGACAVLTSWLVQDGSGHEILLEGETRESESRG